MMELEFDKICRVCLNEGVMLSVFKVNVSKKMMWLCPSIQVWQNDGLPAQICNKCCAKLHIAFQFKKQCEKADGTLRQYLLSMENREDKLPENQNVARSQESIIHQNQEINKLENIQIDPNNSTIPQQAPCIFIENNTTLGGPPTNYIKCDHFMSVQNHSVNQGSYIITNQNNLQMSNCNVQDGQIAYNTQYTIPVENVQQPADIHNEVLPAPVPNQMITQIEDRDMRLKENKNFTLPKSQNGKQCPTCNKVFGTSTKLSRHMKTHSGEKPYKCKTCNKEFAHSGNFKIHMRMHTGERPFKCPVCDRGCRQAQDLEKHMRTHTGERPHKCPMCPKAFSTSSNLTAHIRTHTGERPYVCCVCQKAFCQSNELTKHMRTHTGEKSHICDICNRGFNGSSTLIVHKRSHTGERPYVCKLCNKGFTQSSILATHLRKHKASINCMICNTNFTNQTDLRDHLVMQHEMSDSEVYDMLMQISDVDELVCNVCNKNFAKASDYKKHIAEHLNAE